MAWPIENRLRGRDCSCLAQCLIALATSEGVLAPWWEHVHGNKEAAFVEHDADLFSIGLGNVAPVLNERRSAIALYEVSYRQDRAMDLCMLKR